MKLFNFTMQKPRTKNVRPANPAMILPLESRQLMSAPVPTPLISPPAFHGEDLEYAAGQADVRHFGLAFAQTDGPGGRGFFSFANGAAPPAGLIGVNLVGANPVGTNLVGAGPLNYASVFAPFVGGLRDEAVVPALATSPAGTSSDPASTSFTTPTPGSGLSYLVQQASEMAGNISPAAVTQSIAGLTEISAATSLATSSTFHTQGSAIAAKLENVIALLGRINSTDNLDPIPQDLPAISTSSEAASAIFSGVSPVIQTVSHLFADSLSDAENEARNIGEAFLQSVVSDLVQFESGLQTDSIVTQLGRSLTGWRAAAVAGAVLAAGTYLQRNDEDQKIDSTIPGCRGSCASNEMTFKR